jgi:hypothetical protein
MAASATEVYWQEQAEALRETLRRERELHRLLQMQSFAAPQGFAGRCLCCGGPAVLVEQNGRVYVRAEGAPPPEAGAHPAANGWSQASNGA